MLLSEWVVFLKEGVRKAWSCTCWKESVGQGRVARAPQTCTPNYLVPCLKSILNPKPTKKT